MVYSVKVHCWMISRPVTTLEIISPTRPARLVKEMAVALTCVGKAATWIERTRTMHKAAATICTQNSAAVKCHCTLRHL